MREIPKKSQRNPKTLFIVFFFKQNVIFFFRIFFGRFDTSGSLIPLSVSEIAALEGFCDEQELGILVVGYSILVVGDIVILM